MAEPESEEPVTARVPSAIGRPRDPTVDEAIILATRRRLVLDGYSAMSLTQIAVDAGVSRPAIYRRWSGKFALVVDALDWGLQNHQASAPPLELDDLTPFRAFREAIRRIDPCFANPDAIVMQGGIIGEQPRTPELLELLRDRAVGPRMELLSEVIATLRRRGAVRDDIDVDTVVTMCFGSFFGAFLRGTSGGVELADQVAASMWPALTTEPDRR